jgi:hypothetical protein
MEDDGLFESFFQSLRFPSAPVRFGAGIRTMPPRPQMPLPVQNLRLFFIDDDDSIIEPEDIMTPSALSSEQQPTSSFFVPFFMSIFGGLNEMEQDPAESMLSPCMTCRDDLEKFCVAEIEAHPDEMLMSSFALQMCLMRRREEIAPQCLASLSNDENLVTMCHADIDLLCSSVQPGGSRVHSCLRGHESELSDTCNRQVGRAALRLTRINNDADPSVTTKLPKHQSTTVESLDKEMNNMISAMDSLFRGTIIEEKLTTDETTKEETTSSEKLAKEAQMSIAKTEEPERSETKEVVAAVPSLDYRKEEDLQVIKAGEVAQPDKVNPIASERVAEIASRMNAMRGAGLTSRVMPADAAKPNMENVDVPKAPSYYFLPGGDNEDVRKAFLFTGAAAGLVGLVVVVSVSQRLSKSARGRRDREIFRRSYAPSMI